jgi:ribonuclease P protein component
LSVTQRPANNNALGFPKKNRLLGSSDFRRVYDRGSRFTTPLFAAFLLARDNEQGPRIGFTVPRALGRAVRRNRIKRRMREGIRLRLPLIAAKWDIVINPRKAVLDASWESLSRELDRLVSKCGIS